MIDIAHIHPMIVHFPIVLFMIAVGLQFIVVLRSNDLAANRCLSNAAFATLLLGALAAIIAAVFGDMAFDKAMHLGFPKAPLETHAEFGFSTMWYFLALSAVHIFARWRRLSLAGFRGWILFLLGICGVGLLLITAYHGGDLVYRLGVNVTPIKP